MHLIRNKDQVPALVRQGEQAPWSNMAPAAGSAPDHRLFRRVEVLSFLAIEHHPIPDAAGCANG